MEKNTRKRGFVSYLTTGDEAGVNISWGSILAGLVSFFAIFITLSLIGFGIVKPTSDSPLDGVGTGLTIWTVVTFILALFCSGFISGVASRRIGLLHGFLTWATSVLVLVAILSYTAMAAYLFQGWNTSTPGNGKYKDLLLDTDTEEIGHIEMLAHLLDDAPLSIQENTYNSGDPSIATVMGGMNPQVSYDRR